MKLRPRTHVIRLHDASDLHGLNKRRVADFTHPADNILLSQGTMEFAEVKSTINPTSFAYGDIRKAQKAACVAARYCGTAYNFYIHSLHHERWFILPGADVLADIAAGKKSRKWSELTPWEF